MNFIIIGSFVVWAYLLIVLKRAKLLFWEFLVGSVGTFILFVIYVRPILVGPLQNIVAAGTGLLGNATEYYTYDFIYNTLFIPTAEGSLSLFIDFECSGIIEIGAFVSLLLFFPVYNFVEKTILSVMGIVVIVVANIIRIFIICWCIHTFGSDIYFYAHTIIGRMFFYGVTIFLYFYVFTKSQVIRQKIGRFSYDLGE